MKCNLWFRIIMMLIPSFLLAQEVGTMADTPFAKHISLQFSYGHLSRNYEFEYFREKVVQDIFKGTLSYSPGTWVNLFGFIGTSNFPISIAHTKQKLYYGGGIKFMLLGGEVFIEEQGKDTVHIKGGIGLDFQIVRLQSRDTVAYRNLGLTEYQATIDLGFRIFMVAGYIGFKFSHINGNLALLDETSVDIKGKGLFSIVLGLNYALAENLALTSEISFFTKKSWSLGFRVTM